jgi:cytochrome oxidase Cu insertion factor (SCO1/SenC/PrrC family)
MLRQRLRVHAVRKGLRLLALAGTTVSAWAVVVIGAAVAIVWGLGAVSPTATVGQRPAAEIDPTKTLPRVGDQAPDFTLRDLDGKEVRLSDYRGRMPVVIEFGSGSCPLTRGHACMLDELAHKYQGKAEFLFVYGNEDHPGDGGSTSTSYGVIHTQPQVRDWQDRQEHARQFREEMHVQRRVLVDEDGTRSVVGRYGRHLSAVILVSARGHVRWEGPPEYGALENVLEEETAGARDAPGRYLAP